MRGTHSLAEESEEEVILMPERRRAPRRKSLLGMNIAGVAVLILGIIGLAFAFVVPGGKLKFTVTDVHWFKLGYKNHRQFCTR